MKNNAPYKNLHYLSSGKLLTLMLLIIWTNAYGQKNKDADISLFVDNLFSITEVMVTDVASPTAAARFYAYSTLGAHLAYEYATSETPDNLLFRSNYNQPLYIGETEKNLVSQLVATYTLLEVGKQIMPSGKLLAQKQEELIKYFSKGRRLSKKQLLSNIRFAEKVAMEVMKLARKDGYNELSTYTRYSPKKDQEGNWYPTPPSYMAAIDPEWRTLKTFFIDDLKGFKPKPPAHFSLEKGSDFMNQLEEVYQITSRLTEEEKLVANFWDCNPFKVSYSGHMAMGLKKISPGGHWMGITGIASQKANLSWKETLYIHALLAMTLHDAFISCWEEKYNSDRIRPETAINKYLDQKWRPILQTPPFPEYTSGHSVISSASAVLLTDYFGDDFEFIDTSEVYFGLPERSFESFLQASEEAAISRLYGGIHFRDAIDEGVKQGEKIGHYIVSKIK